MDTVHGLLDEIERLHEKVMAALIQSEAPLVEQLVVQQTECMKAMLQKQVLPEHRDRLPSITRMIQEQQVLIEQASAVASHFLKNIFYRNSAFSQRG